MDDLRGLFATAFDEVRRLPREVGALFAGRDAAVDDVDSGVSVFSRNGPLLLADGIDVVEPDVARGADATNPSVVCPVSEAATTDSKYR